MLTRRVVLGVLSLSLFLLLAACGAPPSDPGGAAPSAGPAEKLKVAFIYVGPVGDAGWSRSHDEARKDLEQQFDFVETAYLESVPEGAESERVLSQFAEKGYKVIFATSFGYMDSIIKVAQRYPDVVFMHCSGYKRAENVGTYFGRMYQAKYLAGLIAGRQTKTGQVGFVAPHPIPEVIRHINAFALGVRAANPTATVHVVWTNSWFDPGKEKEAAFSLLDAGCDLVATGADSAAPMQAAQERGALAIGYDSDGRQFAPQAFLTAPMWRWSVVYRDVIKKVHDGTWVSSDYWDGLDSGVVELAPLSDLVPQPIKDLVAEQQRRIAAGELVVFAGPWKWQDGTLAYGPGQVPSDVELLKMNVFVEGVVGTIPQ